MLERCDTHAVGAIDRDTAADVLVDFLEVTRSRSFDKVVHEPLKPQRTLYVLLHAHCVNEHLVSCVRTWCGWWELRGPRCEDQREWGEQTF